MSQVTMNYEQAHAFVEKSRLDVRWDGYDMVFFKPTPFGFTNTKGAYRRERTITLPNGKSKTVPGAWGMESRIGLSADGTWKVPAKNVKV